MNANCPQENIEADDGYDNCDQDAFGQLRQRDHQFRTIWLIELPKRCCHSQHEIESDGIRPGKEKGRGQVSNQRRANDVGRKAGRCIVRGGVASRLDAERNEMSWGVSGSQYPGPRRDSANMTHLMEG